LIGKGIKIGFLVLILGYFSFPLVQQLHPIISKEKPLDGYFEASKDTLLKRDTWFSRVYQERKENYLNENFGFRAFLVRLNNQVNFSLFDEIKVQRIIKGKRNYLFTSDFLQSYSGRSFVGNEAHADSVFTAVQKLNEQLAAMNKKLLVCIAPCKESFYPEYLPDSCQGNLSKSTYYNYYRSKFLASNIPFLDFNDYFLKMKPNAKYPLFTQGALHWTIYGAALAMDSLFKRVRFEIGKNMNLVKITSVELSDHPRKDDEDEGRSMNLLKRLNSEELAYPVIESIYSQDSCYRPKVLIIGDSFFYQINNTWIPMGVFSNESYFMYYFRTAISYAGKPDQDVSKMNMAMELENTDIVILFYNIGNMSGFPFGATKMVQN
jgi:hypothetical protein